MDWQSVPFVLPLLISAAISAALALYACRRRSVPGATAFVWLMLAGAWWSLAYALELGSASKSAKLFWVKVEYPGIVTVPMAWLAFVLQYTGREKRLSRRNLLLLAIVPLVTLMMAWTSEMHRWFYRSTRLDTDGYWPVLDLTYRGWFWVHMAYSYLLFLLGTLLLLRMLRRSPSLYRGQARALLTGALVPWLGSVMYIFDLTPIPNLDLTPFAFTITGLAMTWGLFRFRLLDLVPVARDAVIEEMSDGVIMIDAQDRIVDLNPAAERIVGRPATETIGQPIAQALFALPGLADRDPTGMFCSRDMVQAQKEIVLPQRDKAEMQRTYDLRISPLCDRRGRLIGRLVVLRDVTERIRMEQALRESEERFRRLSDAAEEGIAIHDQGVIVDANEAFARMFGYELSEMIGMYAERLATPESWKTITKHIATGYDKPYEGVGVRKDGSTFDCQLVGKPYEYQGKTLRVATFRDITEHKRAEEALQERTAQLEGLRQVGLELIAELDLEALLGSIASRACQLLGCRSGGLYLYRPERDVLEWTTAVGPDTAPLGSTLHRGEGVSGRVWESGKPLIANDYQNQKWEGRAAIVEENPWAAIVAAPIHWGADFLGVLAVVANTPRSFSPADAELLDLFAAQAAIAIRNARLYEIEQTRHRVADSLREVSQIISSTLELDQVLHLILGQLDRVLDFDAAALLLVDKARDELYVREWRGYPEGTEKFRLPLSADKGITVHVARTGQPIYVPDTSQDARYIAADFSGRSELAVPLKIKDRVIGILNTESEPPHAYTEDDFQLLITFAHQAAIAIENARLHEQERVSRERAEALREAAQVLGARLELDDILRLILEQLKRVLVYDTASVLVLREGDAPDLVAGLGYADERVTSREAGRLLQDSPILRQMARDLEPIVSPDVRQLDGWIWVPGAEHVRSWLAVPMVARGQMIGALMADKAQVGAFGQAEVEMAQALARHAAQAIENAWLFETEQGRARELSEALKRQKELDRLQADFIQNVSHELRTPLGLVRGYAEMLNSGALGILGEDQREPVAIILRRARSLSELVEDFTAILELEAREVESRPVDLTEVIEQTLADFGDWAERQHITLRSEVAADTPPVMGEFFQLRKVLDNLLSNALKFTPAGGEVDVSLDYDAAGLKLQVADTGVGIPPDKLDRVFERFYQVDGSTSRRYGGTGLGLALVKEIVEAHHGTVTVESELKQGSTFTVWLPTGE